MNFNLNPGKGLCGDPFNSVNTYVIFSLLFGLGNMVERRDMRTGILMESGSYFIECVVFGSR